MAEVKCNVSLFLSGCGGKFVGSTGYFKSPGHPNNYEDNANCTWKIQVLSGRTVQVVIEEMNIVSGANSQCAGDYLEVCIR